jgi:hypothetical protein
LSFWTWALKQYCRVWKTLQLLFWAFLRLGFKSTENFVLQIGPYISLILRISPWGNPITPSPLFPYPGASPLFLCLHRRHMLWFLPSSSDSLFLSLLYHPVQLQACDALKTYQNRITR